METIFRRESARLVSVLTRIFGPHNLDLAEDVVQESFTRAVERWTTEGLPENPGGWLLATARNRAIDVIRRERTRRTFAGDLAMQLGSEWTVSATLREAFEPDALRDDQLRMIFMCCHEDLRPENRVTLILKTLCGLSVPAIARALVTTESTINKRLYRTRRQVRDFSFGVPTGSELHESLETVHTSLYLVFNEGYLSTGAEPIRRDLCRDAVAMTNLLATSPGIASSATYALLAVMSFHRARQESRVDEDGDLVPLDRQDRGLWDRAMINAGFDYLNRARRIDPVAKSRYHYEAAIAARHCSAPTFENTDWESICKLHDGLIEIQPTPVVALSRAVAISFRDGPEAAIPVVDRLRTSGQLDHSHAVAAVLANLYARAGSIEPALGFLEEALAQATTSHERRLLELQIRRAREQAATRTPRPS